MYMYLYTYSARSTLQSDAIEWMGIPIVTKLFIYRRLSRYKYIYDANPIALTRHCGISIPPGYTVRGEHYLVQYWSTGTSTYIKLFAQFNCTSTVVLYWSIQTQIYKYVYYKYLLLLLVPGTMYLYSTWEFDTLSVKIHQNSSCRYEVAIENGTQRYLNKYQGVYMKIDANPKRVF